MSEATVDLQELLDKQAIMDVQVEYALALDANEFDRLDHVFLPDGQALYGGVANCDGIDEIKRVCSGALTPLSSSHHLLGNHWAAVDGDTATAGCYFQAMHTLIGSPGGDNYIIAGAYTDELVRTPDGWRIKVRRLEQWWVEGSPAVAQGATANPEV